MCGGGGGGGGGRGGWVFCVKRRSLFLLPENHVIFSVGLKPRYILFFGQSKSKFFLFVFFVLFFDNHIIQANHPELLIQAY